MHVLVLGGFLLGVDPNSCPQIGENYRDVRLRVDGLETDVEASKQRWRREENDDIARELHRNVGRVLVRASEESFLYACSFPMSDEKEWARIRGDYAMRAINHLKEAYRVALVESPDADLSWYLHEQLRIASAVRETIDESFVGQEPEVGAREARGALGDEIERLEATIGRARRRASAGIEHPLRPAERFMVMERALFGSALVSAFAGGLLLERLYCPGRARTEDIYCGDFALKTIEKASLRLDAHGLRLDAHGKKNSCSREGLEDLQRVGEDDARRGCVAWWKARAAGGLLLSAAAGLAIAGVALAIKKRRLRRMSPRRQLQTLCRGLICPSLVIRF